MNREMIIGEITKLLDSRVDVLFAYLFGSVATGKVHAGSDADIAVFFAPGLDKMARFDRRLVLMGQLTDLLGMDVDVVDLNAAPLSLRHFIMRDGILIVDKDRKQRTCFEVSSRREYFDLKRYLDRRTEAMLRQL
jgi:predicted nucleotidyltransferase